MAGIAATTDVGTYRTTNEDACCLQVATTALGEVVMSVVCDGVGGLSQGELASTTVVRRTARWFQESLPKELARMAELDVCLLDTSLDDLLETCNAALWAYGRRTGSTVATTFTGVVVGGGRYLVGQVGDSRLYVVRDGRCEQVTSDQTLVAHLVENGALGESEARRHPQGNVILQAVGAADEVRPVFSTGSYDGRDLFVLCTDGIYRTCGADGIADSFGACPRWDDECLLEACDELVARAIMADEHDNLTIACFAPDACAHVPGRVSSNGEDRS